MNDLESRVRSRLNFLKKKYPDRKISQRWLAKKAGVSLNSVAKWLNGSTKELKTGVLHLAAEALECSPAWLAGLSDVDNQQSNAVMPENLTFGIVEEQEDLSAYVEFDMYDIKLSAGNGSSAVSWTPTKEAPLIFLEAWTRQKGYKPSTHKGLYVRGDSMEPVLKNWDTVLIDTSDTELINGEIYSLVYKNNFFIKEARIQADGVELVSLNPKYTPILVKENEADKLQILGRMVWRGG